MATKARRPARKKSTSAKKRGAAKKSRRMASSRKASSRSRRSTSRRAKSSPVARVKRVTREVVQQAAVAVSSGVETLKDFGGNLVDRVRS
jgi:hypothetical protein